MTPGAFWEFWLSPRPEHAWPSLTSMRYKELPSGYCSCWQCSDWLYQDLLKNLRYLLEDLYLWISMLIFICLSCWEFNIEWINLFFFPLVLDWVVPDVWKVEHSGSLEMKHVVINGYFDLWGLWHVPNIMRHCCPLRFIAPLLFFSSLFSLLGLDQRNYATNSHFMCSIMPIFLYLLLF